jgi:hypothetical protein
MEPYGITIFCDDIRFEQQGTLSLVGCYGADLNVFPEFPVPLPKFCFFIQLRIPAAAKYYKTLKIVIYLPGDEEGRPTFVQELPNPPEESVGAPSGPVKDDGAQPILAINYPIIMTPFLLRKEGQIKVRALLDDKIIRIGTLKIKKHGLLIK